MSGWQVSENAPPWQQNTVGWLTQISKKPEPFDYPGIAWISIACFLAVAAMVYVYCRTASADPPAEIDMDAEP